MYANPYSELRCTHKNHTFGVPRVGVATGGGGGTDARINDLLLAFVYKARTQIVLACVRFCCGVGGLKIAQVRLLAGAAAPAAAATALHTASEFPGVP